MAVAERVSQESTKVMVDIPAAANSTHAGRFPPETTVGSEGIDDDYADMRIAL